MINGITSLPKNFRYIGKPVNSIVETCQRWIGSRLAKQPFMKLTDLLSVGQRPASQVNASHLLTRLDLVEMMRKSFVSRQLLFPQRLWRCFVAN